MDVNYTESMIQDMRNMKSDFEDTYYPLLSMISDVSSQLECMKKDAVFLRNEVVKKDEIINDLLKTSDNNIMGVSDDIKVMENEIKHLNDLVVFLWNQKNEGKSLSSTLDTDDSILGNLYSEVSEISDHVVKSPQSLNIDDRYITTRKRKHDYCSFSHLTDIEEDEKHFKHFHTSLIFFGTQLHRWKLNEELQKAQLEKQKQNLEEKALIAAVLFSIKEMVNKRQQEHDNNSIYAALLESIKDIPPPQITSTTTIVEKTNHLFQHVGEWNNFNNGFPAHAMLKMGYDGRGLGKDGNGRTLPITVQTHLNHNTKNVTRPSVEVPPWPKNTVLVAGSSMVRGLREDLLSKYLNVKVRSNSGATTRDMFDHLNAFLRKKPKFLILHVGANDSSNTNVTADMIFNRLTRLKSFAEHLVPGIIVIISCPMLRTDDRSANIKLTYLREKLKNSEHKIISNANISHVHLGKKGLHLNDYGVKRFAMNLLACMRSL